MDCEYFNQFISEIIKQTARNHFIKLALVGLKISEEVVVQGDRERREKNISVTLYPGYLKEGQLAAVSVIIHHDHTDAVESLITKAFSELLASEDKVQEPIHLNTVTYC